MEGAGVRGRGKTGRRRRSTNRTRCAVGSTGLPAAWAEPAVCTALLGGPARGRCRSRGHSGPTEERGVPARTELPTHTSGKSQEQRPVREGLQGRGGTSLAQETSSRPGRRERTVGGQGEGIRGPAARGEWPPDGRPSNARSDLISRLNALRPPCAGGSETV